MSSRSSAPWSDSLYDHGFVRVAAAVPNVRPADPAFNAERTLALAQRAAAAGAALVVFPELGISAYAIDDLLHQEALLRATLDAIDGLVRASAELRTMLIVGAPLRAEQGLFNTAVVIHQGRVLGVVPKSYLPEYREYYEKRQFRAARDRIGETMTLLGEDVPFGPDLLFAAGDLPELVVHVEICEDLWAPIPPSSYAALAGATVLVNLSASNITIGKADHRRLLCEAHSSRMIAAYVFTAAGDGESTTDLAWDGQALICEHGAGLVEAERFAREEQLLQADVDVGRLVAERGRISSFTDAITDHRDRVAGLRRIPFAARRGHEEVALERTIERFPYVPAGAASRAARCQEVYNIQVRGLETRMRATGTEKVVIGVSGGLDSTHALIVAVRAVDRLGLPRENVLAYTMPGFATSGYTLANAHRLMAALGVSAEEIDIRPSALQMLRDIEHPAAGGAEQYDVTYENVQAGERTSHLFRLANFHKGIVIGTGDLSELALGWATYGVGDHMSHYSVNASVPKTLIQFLLRWAIDTEQFTANASAVLADILDTEISPELIPVVTGDKPAAATESVVGPYELNDFFLYHTIRYGFAPSKIAYLARHAWQDRTTGVWPDLIPQDGRNEYTPDTLHRWLDAFLERFFHTSQFKRSTIPNAPKVGSGGSLSPRGDWRAPSDGSATAWRDELRRAVEGS
jgi:NAD+ synthase (glutamine-hydrolysing)